MLPSVFITGADKGLGLSLAARFLCEGFQVFVGIFQSDEKLISLVEQYPQTLTSVYLDVTEYFYVRQAASEVAKKIQSLDILINNAGIHLEDQKQPLEDLNELQMVKVMDVNAFGPIRVIQQFLPLLEKGKRKLVINISSEAGSIGNCTRIGGYSYCMSKAALNMGSKILQNYLGPRGFKVLSIHPGWMRTDMGGSQADLDPDESAKDIFQLALKPWRPEDDIYIDHYGKAINW